MMPRVAVVHPHLLPGGGSEACAMWTARALQDDCRVTLITMGRPDLEALNRSCGSDVDPGRIEVRALAIPPGLRTRFDALRGFRLERHCRRHSGDFDVLISAYNAMDFGVPGIQMIADFAFDDGLRRELHAAGGAAAGPFHRGSAGRRLYLALARALAGSGGDGWKRNRTVACSAWVRGLLAARFAVASEVVYPPVAGGGPKVPWEEREDGFVVMGRLVPEKGIGPVADVLARVREKKPVHLHVLGRPVRAAYAREIDGLRRRHGDWVHLEGPVYGPEKEAFLGRHKYGISGCRNEAFGIAVAEMVKAGAIVWVPDGGGQTEIVAHPGLVYAGPENAAALILEALGDPDREAGLRRHLEARGEMFSGPRFVAGMRAVVEDFLKVRHGLPA
jgi:glycosyltransferase involved in cell wall biosynthesis